MNFIAKEHVIKNHSAKRLNMFLSSTHFGLIACRYLVIGYKAGIRISAPDLAARYNMNTRALMPALRRLTQVGILRSQVGGRDPGFIFSKDPKEISLYDVIYALEGENEMNCCKEVISDISCDMNKCCNCIIYGTIKTGLSLINNQLKDTSLYEHYLTIANEKSD